MSLFQPYANPEVAKAVKPSLSSALRTIAEAALPGASISVPREVLLQLLPEDSALDRNDLSRDLTVSEVGAHFGRSPTTVRAWLEADLLPGAYKLRGKSWRVPRSGLEAMRQAQVRVHPNRPRTTPVVKLDAWRRPA
jgi:hypothetical protein